MEKTVAVIIPCYNYAHYLAECLDSLLRQTYPISEIIVVDDGGKDNAEEICQKYPQVKYYRKENGGLSSARNYGIARCTSEYYMALDADDKLTPAGIEEHVKLLTDDGMTVGQCSLMEFGERHVVFLANPGTSLERIMQSNTMFCNCMFPRKAWEEVGGYDEHETMRLGYEDWEFNIRVLEKGYKVATSDFIALRYRVHEGQMTQATSHPKRQTLYNYIYKKHKEWYDERNLLVADIILEQ